METVKLLPCDASKNFDDASIRNIQLHYKR